LTFNVEGALDTAYDWAGKPQDGIYIGDIAGMKMRRVIAFAPETTRNFMASAASMEWLSAPHLLGIIPGPLLLNSLEIHFPH